MDVRIATVAQRPDLAPLLRQFNTWPAFTLQDPVGSVYNGDAVSGYPEYVLVAVDRDHPDRLLAKGLPFDTTGPVTVPEALVPVYCDAEQDFAVYCAPCVWVHHPMT